MVSSFSQRPHEYQTRRGGGGERHFLQMMRSYYILSPETMTNIPAEPTYS